ALNRVGTAAAAAATPTSTTGAKNLLDDSQGLQYTPNPVTPGNEEQSMDYQEIMQKMHGMKPGDVTQAATAFKNLGTQLDTVTAQLRAAGNQLAENWSGPAAAQAMQKFQTMHDQAAQLAAQAHTTGNVAHWVGGDVMQQFQSIPSPQVLGGGN